METRFPAKSPPFKFRLAGPAILCLLAFTGVFARGLANGAFALLLAWAIADLALRRRAGLPGLSRIPRVYWAGAGAFLGIYALAAACGGDPAASFRKLGLLAYLLCILPAVWLALDELPPLLPGLLPLCYGAGLIVAGAMTFVEADCRLACVRAKASLGVLELAAVLGQLAPIMVAALALSRRSPRRVAFYGAAILAAGLALALNCSRIALVCVPLLSLMTFVAFRRELGLRLCLVLVAIAAACGAMSLADGRVAERFSDMADLSGENYSNEVRFLRWRQGLSVFREHPVLGAGPGAIPSPPAELFPEGHGDGVAHKYYHSHQVFITVLAEAGVLGMIGFLALHLLPLGYALRSLRSERPWTRLWAWAALAVFLQLVLNGLVDNAFTLKPLMYVYWTATATALHLTARERAAAPKARVADPAAAGAAK
ncbi:MAG: O-antigen ligase family protein [Deltaproteobacteria bacterium]|jgi:O-antigen ligase|nr:O-antigen ligase family protein [Deltaproteobacteria bacterium]